MGSWHAAYVTVAGLAALVGTGELVSRYRDEPGRAFKSPAATFYLVLNVAAGVFALAMIDVFDWRFGFHAEGNPQALAWIRVMIAGTASMTLLRSSLFLVRIGNQDVGIGPSSFLMVLLKATDRAVDRRRATERDKIISDVMKDVSFTKAFAVLPAHCFGLMQNLSKEEQAEVAQQVSAIRDAKTSDRAKAYLLGLTLLNLVGARVLRDAIATLGDDIKAA